MGWWNIGIAAVSVVGAVVSANAASNTAGVARQAAELQWDIANRIQARSEDLHALWRENFRAGELAVHAQISQLRPHEVNYRRVTARSNSEMRRQFSEARRQTLTALSRYCSLPPAGLINDLSMVQAGAEVWAANAMVRAEDTLKRTLDVQRRQERLQFAQFGRGAYFKSGSGEMAARIAANIQQQAMAAASQQSGAAAKMATDGFQYAAKAWQEYQSSRPDITQQPEKWENDSAMANAQTTSAPTVDNSIVAASENQGGEGGGGGGGGGGLLGGLFGGGGGGGLGGLF